MTSPRLAPLAVVLAAAIAARAGDEERKPAAEKPAAPKREELEKLAQEQFGKFDRNGDGVLRGAELPAEWAARLDRDGDGDVARSEYVEVSSRPEKLRRLHPMRDVRARTQSLLAFDANKDGGVQRDEYPGRDDVFRGADRNRNGSLELAELRALAEEELDDIRKKMRSPGRFEFLSLFDLDGDNKVTPEEYDGPAAALRKFDTDGDGVVTYDELYPERMMRGAKEPAGPKPEQLSAIETLDKDGDGKVARAEFAGGDAAWRRLDVNGDGWITAADAR